MDSTDKLSHPDFKERFTTHTFNYLLRWTRVRWPFSRSPSRMQTVSKSTADDFNHVLTLNMLLLWLSPNFARGGSAPITISNTAVSLPRLEMQDVALNRYSVIPNICLSLGVLLVSWQSPQFARCHSCTVRCETTRRVDIYGIILALRGGILLPVNSGNLTTLVSSL